MQLLNAQTKPLMAPVQNRVPTIVANAEIRWPPKLLTLLPGEPITVSDEDGGRLLERFGAAGLVCIGDQTVPDVPADETVAQAFQRAQVKRHDFLARQLRDYREDQARRKAMGTEIQLPREYHRAMLKELKALEKIILAGDPILAGEFKEMHPRETVESDPLKDELRAFGIPPEAASALPADAIGMAGLELL